MASIVEWNKKNEKYYKFVDMNAKYLQDLFVLTF
jgi:hypothetical protein